MTMVQANADASLLSGNGNPTTVRQAILGFNSGRNLLQDPTVKVSIQTLLRWLSELLHSWKP